LFLGVRILDIKILKQDIFICKLPKVNNKEFYLI
jgi:hypothetical protein